ncbi:hypothetical protein SS50377_25195 [Spironucleus salmonicida]|uniref:Uncharacterized protein n=1 Tax=Spironucleus salmonicida TaxID=348837 RepID=A0A9P8RXN8_9EUKA|nr:hypothetical protein SS50377_25195 [Spironucleus salmonicida]
MIKIQSEIQYIKLYYNFNFHLIIQFRMNRYHVADSILSQLNYQNRIQFKKLQKLLQENVNLTVKNQEINSSISQYQDDLDALDQHYQMMKKCFYFAARDIQDVEEGAKANAQRLSTLQSLNKKLRNRIHKVEDTNSKLVSSNTFLQGQCKQLIQYEIQNDLIKDKLAKRDQQLLEAERRAFIAEERSESMVKIIQVYATEAEQLQGAQVLQLARPTADMT